MAGLIVSLNHQLTALVCPGFPGGSYQVWFNDTMSANPYQGWLGLKVDKSRSKTQVWTPNQGNTQLRARIWRPYLGFYNPKISGII